MYVIRTTRARIYAYSSYPGIFSTAYDQIIKAVTQGVATIEDPAMMPQRNVVVS